MLRPLFVTSCVVHDRDYWLPFHTAPFNARDCGPISRCDRGAIVVLLCSARLVATGCADYRQSRNMPGRNMAAPIQRKCSGLAETGRVVGELTIARYRLARRRFGMSAAVVCSIGRPGITSIGATSGKIQVHSLARRYFSDIRWKQTSPLSPGP